MRTKMFLPALIAATFALAACGDNAEAPEDDKTTETQMDEVEVIDGTITDEMVDLDSSSESDAIDEDAAKEAGAESAESGAEAEAEASAE